jgi:hypothetical protein
MEVLWKKEPTPKHSFQLYQFLEKHEIQNFSKPSSSVNSTAHVKTKANNYLMTGKFNYTWSAKHAVTEYK